MTEANNRNANDEVLKSIPHRAPFLFVDKIISLSAKNIVVERTLRHDEAFFNGHYPNYPIMPGVLLCEATFQAAGIFISKTVDKLDDNKVPVLTRINSAMFKKMAFPGETLQIEVSLDEHMQSFFSFNGIVKRNAQKLLSLNFIIGIVDK